MTPRRDQCHHFVYDGRVRLVTWNCYRGDARHRASELRPLSPDVVVLQEVSPAVDEGEDCVWLGGPHPNQGVAVLVRNGFRLEPAPVPSVASGSVFPVVVTGPQRFHVLAVWAQREPGYPEAVSLGLTQHADFIKAAPTVVIGDFNSHPRWDVKGRKAHGDLFERLRNEFGLVSAYHEAPVDVRQVEERATHYWQWQESQPFHIDYCYLPVVWADKIREIHVGGYEDWAGKSDHRPLLVDVEV